MMREFGVINARGCVLGTGLDSRLWKRLIDNNIRRSVSETPLAYRMYTCNDT